MGLGQEKNVTSLLRGLGAALFGILLFIGPARAANWFESNGWHTQHHHLHKVHFSRHHRHNSFQPALPAAVVVHVNIGSQSMVVDVDGSTEGRWAISSARPGYHTPRGSYRVSRLARVYYSKKYDNSPMPNSVFFYGGYAIHGTYHVGSLGRPASHGCVRLSPANAATLYAWVERYGMSRTRVIISD